jgi:hypothetical protein
MKAYRGSRYIVVLILNLGTSRFGRFTPRKEPWYPFNMRSDGPQNRSEQFGEQQNLLSLLGFEPQTVQPRNLGTLLTELHRLQRFWR